MAYCRTVHPENPEVECELAPEHLNTGRQNHAAAWNRTKQKWDFEWDDYCGTSHPKREGVFCELPFGHCKSAELYHAAKRDPNTGVWRYAWHGGQSREGRAKEKENNP